MSDNTLLQINHLKTEFRTRERTVTAVDDVSFSIEAGRTLGIVGESGSGKSVTALSIMRLLPGYAHNPQGEILFSTPAGKTDLLKQNDHTMQGIRGNDISMIFQEPMTSLNPVMTCGAQVAEALILHKGMTKDQAYKRTLELFDQVELPRKEQMYKSYPHQISGGQKQRVMIAMAMSCDPALLIADEPTTALDVTVQKSILELIVQLQAQKGMSVIFITHDLGVVGEIADEVLVMYRGKAVEQGKVRDIFNQPQHPYTKGLIACRPPSDVRPARLLTLGDFMDRQGAEKESGSDKIRTVSSSDFEQRLNMLKSRPPVLSVKGLKKYYPARKKGFFSKPEMVKAVDDVSFDVYPGETLGLVGESGCGKTTLGRTILRLIEPTAGEIIYKKEKLTPLKGAELRRLRKQIQIIFQDPYSSLNPRIPIGKAIMEPMMVHGIGNGKMERESLTRELLEKVRLSPDHFDRYPHEFSGGQRQRVCIARALAVNPEFIICDESVSALDVSVQASILNLLKDLQEERNLTYIFISHDLSVIKFMSDRILVMEKGKIIETGDAENLYKSPQSPYTQNLIDAVPEGTSDSITRAINYRQRLRAKYSNPV